VNDKKRYILEDILIHVKSSVQRYLVGIIIEMIIVSTLTSIGFMIIGVQYAVLLGIITGLLNLIPYVGILSAGLLSIFATLGGESDLNIVLGVIVVNVIVQLIDNNLVVPLIVSSNVRINAMASIIGIIIGGSLLGIAGMFLAIPLIAILKVVFDRVDSLKPIGLLLGDVMPKV
jgi:predicted PurR-regulated permease PerM